MTRDPLVAAAVAHWAPRFVANGVDFGDFQQVTEAVGRWDEWCAEWSRMGARHEAWAEEAAGRGRWVTATQRYLSAALCYHFGKFLFVHDPRQLRAAHERTVACYQKASAGFRPPARRIEVPFAGARLAAYLRRPEGSPGAPLVLLLPGLDSVKEELHFIAEEFLRRGVATCAMDGPGQGEAEFDLPIRADYESAVGALLDVLVEEGEAASGRVGVMGVSLGGYYAARTLALEPRVAAAVSVGGFDNFGEAWEGLPPLTRRAFTVRSRAGDEAEARAKACALCLGERVRELRRPLLVIHGGRDRIAPPEQARRLAAAAPGARLVLFEEGNHVCNNMAYRYRALAADWLAEQLSP